MTIKFHASTDARIDVYVTCDDSIIEHNDREVLERYAREGDDSGLTVPEDATRFTIKPLGPREFNALKGRAPFPAGVLPPEGIVDDPDAVDGPSFEEQMLAHFESLPEDAQEASNRAITEWRFDWDMATCALALQAVSDLPGVAPVRANGSRIPEYPEQHLLTLPDEAIAELAAHIRRVSQLGKAASGR